jgi:hypothetical protein
MISRVLAVVMFSICIVGTVFSDVAYKADPSRPVCELGRDMATLQWYTREPCETKVQLREGGIPSKTPQPEGKKYTPWTSEKVQVVVGPGVKKNYHRVTINNLKPATRYYYRVYDPSNEPTGEERDWGAEEPWRRERAFSTFANAGERTVIRVPVKVLIMPNVINISSAYNRATGEWAPPPPPLTEKEIEKVRDQYHMASLFYFLNNGFRVWHDVQIFVDDRWQRWGDDYPDAPEFYCDLPACRNWPGVDFVGSGGGKFTAFDTGNITNVCTYPVFEKELYVGVVENPMPKKYNQKLEKWDYMRSGGGTLGIDGWAQGIPTRAQYLGDDIAWLMCHEYHHQIESQGHWSGMNREDDRVIFDHFSGRYRRKREDGTWDEFTWDTNGKFGEHWSGIAHLDRTLSDIQWLRWYFGETISVEDEDDDGVPDNDSRLPFDEKRFGSSPEKVMTDGEMTDYDKVRLSIWSPGPLQSMWTRPDDTYIRPNPRVQDSDGDGIHDRDDSAPMVPYPAFIWPYSAKLDGTPDEWAPVPVGGRIHGAGMDVVFKQSHDDDFYYGLLIITGDWRNIRVTLDGEADGVYGPGVGGFGGSLDGYWLTFRNTHNRENPVGVTLRTKGGGFTNVATLTEGTTVIEFSIPNRGESTWYWRDGGREVGTSIDATANTGAKLSMFDGYDPLYAVMLPLTGKKLPPVAVPEALSKSDATVSFDFSQPSAIDKWKFEGEGWELQDGCMAFTNENREIGMYLDGFDTTDFQVWIEFEAERDMIIGAYSAETEKMNAGKDYIAFMGGYYNTVSKIRLEGQGEVCGDRVGMTPGKHTMQFTRTGPYFFMQYDGKLVGWFKDSEKPLKINRLALLGVPGAGVKVYKARIKID